MTASTDGDRSLILFIRLCLGLGGSRNIDAKRITVEETTKNLCSNLESRINFTHTHHRYLTELILAF